MSSGAESFEFYVFSNLVLFIHSGPFGDPFFELLRVYRLDFSSYFRSLRGPYLSLFEERYGRKTNQRAPKPPFGIWLLYGGMRGDVRKSYEFAKVQFTRFRPVRGVRKRTVSTDSIVPRCRGYGSAYDFPQHPHPKGTFSGDADASPSGRSTQRQGNKRSAEADLIASIAQLREGRHKVRPA